MLSIDCLRHLLNKVWSANSKWYYIGLGLELSSDELDSISSKERQQPGECFTEVLKKWLKKQNPRKSQLVGALRQPCIGYEQLAENLHTWVLPGNATQDDDHMVSVSMTTSASEGAG